MILDYNIADLTANSYASFYVNPANTWSSPAININRSWRESNETDLLKVWQFSINHSSSDSSSRNDKALTNTSCLISELTDAVDTLRDMMSRVEEFEAAYQVHREKARAEYAAEEAAKLARIEADTQLTRSQVGHLVATICVDLKHGGKYLINLNLRKRGDVAENAHILTARLTDGGAVQFKLNGQLYSKAKIEAKLCEYAEIIA